MAIISLFIVATGICMYVGYVIKLMCRFSKLINRIEEAYEELCTQRDVKKKNQLCEKIKKSVNEAYDYYYRLGKITFGFESIHSDKRYLEFISEKIEELQEKGSC